MKPLYVLLIVFIPALGILYPAFNIYDLALFARIALSAMLLFTAIAHFVFTKGMTLMMPAVIPFKKELVYLTGFIEIAAAIGLQIATMQIITAWLLILFFILLLPANINAAIKHIDYQKGTTDGSGLKYLWFRIPLQIFFIIWTYFSSIY